MKKLILAILIIFLTSSMIYAGPDLVCDPQAGITEYKLTGPAWVPATIPAESDGSIRLDVTSAFVGDNNIMVSACWVDPLWGVECTTPVPFTFTRPALPGPVGGVKLIQ